jgi:hypothetical protein
VVRLAKHEGTADVSFRSLVHAGRSGGSILIRRMQAARAGRGSKEVKMAASQSLGGTPQQGVGENLNRPRRIQLLADALA